MKALAVVLLSFIVVVSCDYNSDLDWEFYSPQNRIPSADSGDTAWRPTVLWHGMGDTCCNPLSMGRIQKMIEVELPGIYVHSIEVGDTVEQDEMNGFLMNANDQVDYVCQQLASDPKLANGFNAIGFSQGSQFLRAYVERCNSPPVYNLVSIGGQHQGVFGLPKCPGTNYTLCEIMRELLDLGAYETFVQNNLAQANYWHDPFNEALYVARCIFLPDVNNEDSVKNQTYKDNILKLNKFSMTLFTGDTVVQPRESEWFGFYVDGQDKVTVPLQQTPLYTEDWIGLKQLDQQGRLDFLSVDGDHLQFSDEWFSEYIIHGYLNNTLI